VQSDPYATLEDPALLEGGTRASVALACAGGIEPAADGYDSICDLCSSIGKRCAEECTMEWWMRENQESDKELEYMLAVGLPWDERTPELWHEVLHREMEQLRPTIGTSEGGAVLDCSCGMGSQAIALAKLGWQVMATDIAETRLAIARQRAKLDGIQVEWGICDMRDLGQRFDAQFEWVVTCFGLYEITDDADIQRAVDGMYVALKPGGRCYARLRDMDVLMEEKPRHEFHGEVRTPHGRVFCIEDWEYESETHATQIYAFLTEDERYGDWRRWRTEAVGTRKRAIRQSELAQFLARAGFEDVKFLERAGNWMPYEVVAHKK
jgi:glycine/sarcosine N-methyltransferase